MALHWSHRSLPELAHVTRAEQDAAWNRCMTRSVARWRNWLILVPLALVAGLVEFAIIRAVTRWAFMMPGTMAIMIALGLLLGVVQVAALNLVMVAWLRRSLWRDLPDRCHGCGYDLTGNASGRCPECGRETTNPEQQDSH